MSAGLLTGNWCLGAVFVEDGNKENGPCLVQREKSQGEL